MATMKAVRIHAYGGRDVLTYEDAPLPEVGEGMVLIRVAATSVNPFDWAARMGFLQSYYAYALPHILGLDVAGVVEAVGENVTEFSPGDRVFGRSHPSRNGAYAEYVALPASQVAPLPRTLDFCQSAAVPHAASTAWIALFQVANIQPGQRALIHGAAGGVGSFAVQLAKRHGVEVIGTSSAANLDYLRELGADVVIDYNATRFEDVVHDVDLVLDLVGDQGDNTQQRSWQVLKEGGLLASPVQFPSPETAAAHRVRASMVSGEGVDSRLLQELGALIDSGQLRVVVSTIYPLAAIREAHEKSESRHGRGKLSVQVADL